MEMHKAKEVEEGGNFECHHNLNLWTPPMQCGLLVNPSPWLHTNWQHKNLHHHFCWQWILGIDRKLGKKTMSSDPFLAKSYL